MYNILDCIGDMGGLWACLYFCGGFLITTIASKMYLSNLIREIFRVRTDVQGVDIGELLIAVKAKK